MSEIQPLHKPNWQPDNEDWLMIVGNRLVAALARFQPELGYPPGGSLSFILAGEVDEGGWSNVSFNSLARAQHHIEQWWLHAVRNEKYVA
jgi:hypothetical protein